MEFKRTRAEDGNSAKARFEIQDRRRFNKRFSNQSPPTTPRFNNGKGYTPMNEEGK